MIYDVYHNMGGRYLYVSRSASVVR